MGGRGTFAAGEPVSYGYQTIGTIEGVQVLVEINGKHGLPEEVHSSAAYPLILDLPKSHMGCKTSLMA